MPQREGMVLRFWILVSGVFALAYAATWALIPTPGTGSQKASPAQAAKAPPRLRPTLPPAERYGRWYGPAWQTYGPPAPIGQRPLSVDGRLMQQACLALQGGAWTIPPGARKSELCACVGAMMDRAPDADGLDETTDTIFVTGRPPEPASSAIARGLDVARITCQRALFLNAGEG